MTFTGSIFDAGSFPDGNVLPAGSLTNSWAVIGSEFDATSRTGINSASIFLHGVANAQISGLSRTQVLGSIVVASGLLRGGDVIYSDLRMTRAAESESSNVNLVEYVEINGIVRSGTTAWLTHNSAFTDRTKYDWHQDAMTSGVVVHFRSYSDDTVTNTQQDSITTDLVNWINGSFGIYVVGSLNSGAGRSDWRMQWNVWAVRGGTALTVPNTG